MKKFLWTILFLGLFVVSGLLFNLGFEVVRAIAAPFGAVILQSWTGTNMAAVDSSHRLSVSCDNGCGTTSTATDEGSFTQGSSGYTPVGGMYSTSVTNLTSGQAGVARLTNDRKLMASVQDALPTGANTIGAVTQASGPWSTNQTQVAGSTIVADPCQVNTPTFAPINISTATSTVIRAGTSAKKTYVCSMFLFGSTADNVGVVEGTGSTCGTSTAGVIGGATAAAGVNMVANQGFLFPATGYSHFATATNADDLCLITSSTAQLSGYIKSVQQ